MSTSNLGGEWQFADPGVYKTGSLEFARRNRENAEKCVGNQTTSKEN